MRWKPACVNEDRYLHLGPFAGRPRSSVYAMTHLASDRERTAMLCLSGGDRVRVWLNGRVVFDGDQPHTYHLGPEFLAPVTLRAGRNTLLVRVSHGSGGHRCACAPTTSSWITRISSPNSAGGRRPRTSSIGPTGAVSSSIPGPRRRQVELLAALGDRDRYLRAAARLADFDGPVRSRSLRRGPARWA